MVAALTPTGTPLEAVIGQVGVEHVASSLVEVLAGVPDPRHARGIRHSVLVVLVLSACAVLAGARSFVAIGEYAHDVGATVLELPDLGAGVPHESTLRRVLQQLDPAAVETALAAWALAHLAGRRVEPGTPVREQRRVWALDGKTARRARVELPDGGGQEQVHLVSVLDQASDVVLAQVKVAAKAGELTAVPNLLAGLDLREVLLTADALHTQRAHAAWLHSRGGHYSMTAKANQPRSPARLRALPWTDIGVAARERGRGHGRVETRNDFAGALTPDRRAGPPKRLLGSHGASRCTGNFSVRITVVALLHILGTFDWDEGLKE